LDGKGKGHELKWKNKKRKILSKYGQNTADMNPKPTKTADRQIIGLGNGTNNERVLSANLMTASWPKWCPIHKIHS
jgi:hypothetical protein